MRDLKHLRAMILLGIAKHRLRVGRWPTATDLFNELSLSDYDIHLTLKRLVNDGVIRYRSVCEPGEIVAWRRVIFSYEALYIDLSVSTPIESSISRKKIMCAYCSFTKLEEYFEVDGHCTASNRRICRECQIYRIKNGVQSRKRKAKAVAS